jgi:hypothetical protein
VSQLFTSLWNRYHQWLSDIKLIQISAFSASYSRINPCFTAGNQIGVFKLSRNLRTPENGHLHIYSLRLEPANDDLTRPDPWSRERTRARGRLHGKMMARWGFVSY